MKFWGIWENVFCLEHGVDCVCVSVCVRVFVCVTDTEHYV